MPKRKKRKTFKLSFEDVMIKIEEKCELQPKQAARLLICCGILCSNSHFTHQDISSGKTHNLLYPGIINTHYIQEIPTNSDNFVLFIIVNKNFHKSSKKSGQCIFLWCSTLYPPWEFKF